MFCFRRHGTLVRICLLAFIALLVAARADADEIRVMTSGAFREALRELSTMYERETKHHIVTTFGGSMGGGPNTIASRLARGEPADVVILAAQALDELIASKQVVAGSRVDLVRSSIGVVVRAGARRPDISSVDALKRTILAANSIAYSSSASGVYLSTELFPRLGIAGAIMTKSRRIENEPVAAVVARGEAAIGFQQISELLPVAGVDYIGPLPAGAQRVTIFAAGVTVAANAPDAARALIAFLASPAAAGAIRKTGLEPIASSR